MKLGTDGDLAIKMRILIMWIVEVAWYDAML